MPGPLVSEDGGTCHCGQRSDRGTFTQEPAAPVDDTFAAREGYVSPYAHSPALSDGGARSLDERPDFDRATLEALRHAARFLDMCAKWDPASRCVLRRPAVYGRTRYRGGLLMRRVTYSMGVSLDGYIVGPDGDITAPAPDEEVWRFVTDEIREVGVHLMGRRLYETMLYWETADQDSSLDDSEIEWAALWKPLPKVVFSTTLSAVQGNARLASGGLAEEIERLQAEPGEGDIAIGGATLAAEAAALGLIDEYRARVYPVLVGGGIPFFPQRERRVELELVETRTFSSRVVYLRYRVVR
jgi:dihydrofolate reductase